MRVHASQAGFSQSCLFSAPFENEAIAHIIALFKIFALAAEGVARALVLEAVCSLFSRTHCM